jgi:3-hydroxyisobutyrate dehydrogenase-like beta-hydroxyacid dehydrogenase
MHGKIAFVGAGNMGRPMIRHLVAAGYPITVSVRRPEARAAVVALGAEVADSPAAAARDATFICTNVTSTADVEEVLLGVQGAARAAPAGALCVDFSTISPLAVRNLARSVEALGHSFLDAPVSGGVVGAEAAMLSIMVGGRTEVFERARPLLGVLGSIVTHVGDSGAGQIAKACNQIVQVVNIQGIAEAMLFSRANGVEPQTMHFAAALGGDLPRILTAISAGMAGSKMLDLMGPKMASRDFRAGIEARLHAKDFGLVCDVARQANLELPAAERVQLQLVRLLEHGWGGHDTSSLLRVLEADARHAAAPRN